MAPTNEEKPTQDPKKAGSGEDEEEVVDEKGASGQASKDMQNVSKYIADFDSGVDKNKLDEIVSSLSAINKKQKDEAASKSKEQEKIALPKEEIELVMKEFDLSKPAAEKALRDNAGDLEKTLKALLA
ncbi:hypothetical protein K493DRAFT_298767 [Basidiobolus meristosporus CBS 931.73]|uniref:Nascent polypeptide-associated complex subunit alpha-like UBA domain-containing protein n=1 Tax=Basidiobolus meristosporus CBS 931.73 TaxID=1314790 RepID=A0A1Y1YRP6_9FUNG|nr:hypothetical protein K493DRAFT_298767 [Basidiobolus meristosporus CBS 931.73]|eukprot:ORY00708.1 hypothetical protein K493DRAFT_298767 [Basidiobolus meristosporus CBS 931.73]